MREGIRFDHEDGVDVIHCRPFDEAIDQRRSHDVFVVSPRRTESIRNEGDNHA